MSARRGYLPPRNDDLVWVRGVLDDADPVEEDGSPKYIDDATVTWEILDAGDEDDPELALANGTLVASGSGTPVGTGSGGTYLISLGSAIDYADRNWLHVVVTLPVGYKADLLARFDKKTRTGDTPVT